ncbi:hypothetical protein J2Z32_002470 [Paenibacillus turicensis]|uniref:SMODS-associated NUDIX domain-containing protein n=1 Tax=Paenibacillus turicensis TaxID=160487 RepID=A0ABS4FTB5_9BACL|nr:hypothetical protein [Paenibacillus turicensis]MBP1905822.1 hypothetical protein [Paenibacillus turicensis]
MTEFFQKNIISILSLFISILVYLYSVRNSKLNSYNQKGCFSVILMEPGIRSYLLKKYPFNVKIYNSVSSDTIPFEYKLSIVPLVGGISRAQIFSTFDEERSLGISKTGIQIASSKIKNRLSKKYAHRTITYFSSSPIYPYFTASGKINNNESNHRIRINRYHFYIEITDFCNNTQIWYISFSLLLSDDLEKNWERNKDNSVYNSYKFDDIHIVSPKDIPQNLNRSIEYNKSLKEIEDREEDSIDSKALIENGFNKMNYELQRFEMKEYIQFLRKLKDEKYINI